MKKDGRLDIKIQGAFKKRVDEAITGRKTTLTSAVEEGLELWLQKNEDLSLDEVSLIVPRRFSDQLRRLAFILELIEQGRERDKIDANMLTIWEQSTNLLEHYLKQELTASSKKQR